MSSRELFDKICDVEIDGYSINHMMSLAIAEGFIDMSSDWASYLDKIYSLIEEYKGE